MNSIIAASKPVIKQFRTIFFDSKASVWDSRIRPADHRAVERILERITFRSNDTVIDVGSGTGITIPYYKRCGIEKIYACDESSGMVEILRDKFPDISIFHQSYLDPLTENISADKIVIFNTFPHFSSFDPVFRNSARYLNSSGKLIIAHSMNRQEITECHRRKGMGVSNDILPPDDFFEKKFREHGFTDVIVEDSETGFFAAGTCDSNRQ